MGAIEARDTDYQNSWAFETKQIHAGWTAIPKPVQLPSRFFKQPHSPLTPRNEPQPASPCKSLAPSTLAWATRPMTTSRPESLPSKVASVRS